MKKIYLAALALFLGLGLQAQSFTLTANSLTISVQAGGYDYASANITNTTGATVLYQYDLIVNTLQAGWNMQFCDPNACFVSPRMSDQFELQRDASAMFKLEISPNSVLGSGVYTLNIFNVGDPSDHQELTWSINSVVGVDNAALDKQVSIYPNPSNGDLFLASNQGSLIKGDVQVFDLSGKLQLRTEVKAVSEMRINVEGLTPGMYLMRYTTDKGVVNRKFMMAE